jgi:ubiquinone/menaquinone biosynthesis C-methylase UbiE
MQAMLDSGAPYPSQYFAREDPSDDRQFYDWPRKVVHIDESAINALRATYDDLLPASGMLLDLMSAWRSHLPSRFTRSPDVEVVGLGMNADEMADNYQLSRFIVHDLNQTPSLPFEDGAFDSAVCAVSVQYLTQPVAVFEEVARVLKPGALFVVSFSNRCFPTKAVAVWHAGSDDEHIALVRDYFARSGSWSSAQTRSYQPRTSDPLFSVWATAHPNLAP